MYWEWHNAKICEVDKKKIIYEITERVEDWIFCYTHLNVCFIHEMDFVCRLKIKL